MGHDAVKVKVKVKKWWGMVGLCRARGDTLLVQPRMADGASPCCLEDVLMQMQSICGEGPSDAKEHLVQSMVAAARRISTTLL